MQSHSGKGRRITSIDFSLPRGSVIAGRVTDEFGQPLVQAQVSARRFRYTENGQRTLVSPATRRPSRTIGASSACSG